MVDQFVVLTVIGVIILLLGIAMHAAKRRGGLMLILVGVLWLFTMALYYGLVAAGLYGSGSIVLNVIGVLILVVGGALSIVYLRKHLVGTGKRK
jgi:membrane-bound ClpP family serine protease